MSHRLAMRITVLTLAALIAALPAGVATALADDSDTPDWFVPNASYTGVWKTEGQPDLDSQITLGYKGTDGNLIFLTEDGKLALVYGTNPIGAPNHTDVNILATRTEEGFKWGQFDPSRNSTEFTFVVSDGGATLTGARHAMFSGREIFNNIVMTRVAAPSSPSQPTASGPTPFMPPGGDACFMQDRFPPISQNGQRFREQFRRPGDGVSPDHASFVGAWSGRSPDNGEEFRLVVFRVGTPDTRVAFVGSTFQSQGFWTPDMLDGGQMRFESGFGNVNAFRMLEDGNSVELTRGAPGQASVHATLTRCSLD